MTLTMHDDVAAGWAGSGIGGPKKQFASATQLEMPPPQWASVVQRPIPFVPGWPFAQWRSGPAPRVQSVGPVPLLAASASPRPARPDTSRRATAPAGMGAGGDTVRRQPAD